MRKACLLLFLFSLDGVAQDLPQELSHTLVEYEAMPAAPMIERKRFFADAMVMSASLSPDGLLVAAAVREGKSTKLVLLDTSTLQERELLRNDQIRSLVWSKDSRRLFVELSDAVGVLSPDDPAHASYFTRLEREKGDSYLGVADSSGDHVLVTRKRNDAFVLTSVALDGTEAELFSGKDKIEQAFMGAEALFLVLHDEEGRRVVQYKNARLEPIYGCGIPMLNECQLLAYDDERQLLWLKLHAAEDKAGLYAWSVATESLAQVHADPLNTVDLQSVVFQGDEPVTAFYDHGGQEAYALDASVATALAAIQQQVPAAQLTLNAGENAVWLVREDAAVLRESRYFLYRQDGSLQQVLAAAGPTPALDSAVLSAKFPFAYAASDGHDIHAYVSLPKGVDPARAPLVALIHGGPWGRVDARYEQMTQLLVNRGYIVFQPNFRASTGYGKAHVLAGTSEFGNGRVQADITDGANYLLSRGIGNREKVGIVGGSFGGFAVLSGLAFTPDLYRVGVAMVPPADLGYTLMQSLEKHSAAEAQPSIRESLRVLGVNYDDPAALQRLYEKSPQAHLDAIKAPLLITAGADDDRIDIRHVKDYTLRLLGANKPLALLIDEDEGHGFLADDASEVSLYLTETMLSRYLGGKVQALDDPLLQHYLDRRVLLNNVPGFLEDQR